MKCYSGFSALQNTHSTAYHYSLPQSWQVCPLTNPCIGYPLVQLSARLWKIKRRKSWLYLRSILYYTFHLLNTANCTCWFDQILLKQKSPIFSPICSILTFSLYSFITVWKECIINKNFAQRLQSKLLIASELLVFYPG